MKYFFLTTKFGLKLYKSEYFTKKLIQIKLNYMILLK